jgi:filamentous hemagglutinin family protein
MTIHNQKHYHQGINSLSLLLKLFVESTIFVSILSISSVKVVSSQVIPDESLGTENTKIKTAVDIKDESSVLIEGGSVHGKNLFHSFNEFNVERNQNVYFDAPNNIDIVFSRVTGENPTNISGVLGIWNSNSGELGKADLFLINPNGIVFGSHASLDMNGSFLPTTANAVTFPDGVKFEASATGNASLLSINVPTGLQFGGTSASIVNQSKLAGVGSTVAQGLSVPSNNSIVLIGGDIKFNEGTLKLLDGRVELGAVAENSQVELLQSNSGWKLDHKNTNSYKDLSFSQESKIITENGDIYIQGRNILLNDGSQISATTRNSDSGGNLVVKAYGSLEIRGFASTDFPGFVISSSLVNSTIADGNAGDIVIDANRLLVSDKAVIQASSSGAFSDDGTIIIPATGDAGDVMISSLDTVVVSDGKIVSESLALGAAGDIDIKSPNNFVLQNGGEVSVSSASSSGAGNIDVEAKNIKLNDRGQFTATSSSGNGGNIDLEFQDLLLLRNNSKISTSSGTPEAGNGNGGDINISSDFIVANPEENSDIVATAYEGSGGNISLTAQAIFGLEVRDELTPFSDIVTSSEFGVDGTIDINTLEFDPTRSLEDLPANVIDPSGLIAQGCNALGEGAIANRPSEFLVTGRGGLPASPTDSLSSETTFANWVTRDRPNTPIAARQKSQTKTAPIVEAKGWKTNAAGEVVLVAEANPTSVNLSSTAQHSCQRRELLN